MDEFIYKYDLFIFDLDDTIVKTELYHYEAWITTLKQLVNIQFNMDYEMFCIKFHSLMENNIKNYLINELKLINIDNIIDTKNKLYLEIINKNKNNIYLLNGFEVLINNIVNKGKEFVIVSNSLKSNIDFFSELFPILKKSSKNYYREILVNKKPNSECYKKVLIDFPGKRMVGFEDSITGIHSITQLPEIVTYFINNKNYIHYNYIMDNYNVIHINDYYSLM